MAKIENRKIFLSAIEDKKIVKVKVDTFEKWIIERYCVPFDYWPWRRKLKVNPNRYHFYDLDSPDGKHNLSILPEQLLKIEITENEFSPWEYVKWKPNWFVFRNWWMYS